MSYEMNVIPACVYKKRRMDKEKGQNCSPTFHPTCLKQTYQTWRFSVLTLLIALPAAAYATVRPQALSTGSEIDPSCRKSYDWCFDGAPCCDNQQYCNLQRGVCVIATNPSSDAEHQYKHRDACQCRVLKT
jgi:hypothetical protein